MPLQTEDTGKEFEMAICVAANTPYVGPYKYTMATAERLRSRLTALVKTFPPFVHTASRGSQYDFTGRDDPSFHLSAKTVKKTGGKVAPQVIAQVMPAKFCQIIGIPYTNDADLKQYIQSHVPSVLDLMMKYTFDCTNIFYNKQKDSIQTIVLRRPIVWKRYAFAWTRACEVWGNSTTLKVITNNENKVSIAEFQFHNTRKNMAIRWNYEAFVAAFADHFEVTNY
jgi:hypothetical protein